VLNDILRTSYQANAELVVSDIADQSLMVLKLPALNVNAQELDESESLQQYLKGQNTFFKSIFDENHNDTENVVKAFEKAIKVVSEVEFASWFCKGKIISITGTNGKTTTTSLCEHVLNKYGAKTYAAGNIGLAFSEIVLDVKENEFVALETSSFQLDHIETFKPYISTILNITPDHLDRYDYKIENYINSKLNVFKNQNENDFIIGLSPSGGWNSKKCDPIKFAEIGDAIVNKFNAKILLLWGPGDKDEALKISKFMKHKINLAPQTDIRKMGALISKCHILIANDSGPMHISTALNVPTLSLHGPTNPNLQGPFGSMHEFYRLENLKCIECNLLDCPNKHECFMNMKVENIIEKVESLIKKNKIKFANEKA